MSFTELVTILLVVVLNVGFIAAVVGVAALVWRRINRDRAGAGPEAPCGKTAIEILEERYARGEIGADEFEERRSRLLGREG
jgi:uncharacterized membrane protein